jgi:hypothetical protein
MTTDVVNNKDNDTGELAAPGVVQILIYQILDTAAVLRETYETMSIESTHTVTRTIVGLCKLLDETIDRYETLRMDVAIKTEQVKEEAIDPVSAAETDGSECRDQHGSSERAA